MMEQFFAQFLSQFPQLKQHYHYLDSAASSLTPHEVLGVMENYYHNTRANIHRGLYKESIWATELYDDARKKIAAFIGAQPEEIIFTSGSTGAANMLVRMIEEAGILRVRKQIVSTVMEHHGILVPLQQLAKRQHARVDLVSVKGVSLNNAEFDQYITDSTAVVSVMHASNVLGTINPVEEIAAKAHAKGALMLVDATATLGHIPVDVKTLGADAIWFSGHKMYGPTGIGVLWVKQSLLKILPPVVFGGDMVEKVTITDAVWREAPDRYEAGTPNIAGAIGLGAAIDFIDQMNIESIHDYISLLTNYAVEKLSTISGLTIISNTDTRLNIGIIAFTVEGIHPHDLAQILADNGVAVRAGHHCAMPLHEALGVHATTRASFQVYNTKDDIDALVSAINMAKKIFSV